ncbi:hypothetical protein [Curtobacterium sp. CFBP9011]|uniref:hypothetical protein n=1 Tax=Curtobacterium sp. CFBP9011 TaxID=3096530 RepID=UPI002A6A88EC|nr:hypothetical protein [Curtobacterium sp. CFBP9011]MDY1006372.1 hypothetical protein [Curtobacterium sp. CFBP9011]
MHRFTRALATIAAAAVVSVGLVVVPVASASAVVPTTPVAAGTTGTAAAATTAPAYGRYTPLAAPTVWTGTARTTPTTVTLPGIPASATAATLVVQVAAPSAAGVVSVVPVGSTARPPLQDYVRGRTVAGSTTVAVSGGRVQVVLSAGTATVSLVVAGSYGSSGSTYTPVTPTALLAGNVAATTPTTVQVTGRAGVPAGATAAVLDVRVSNPAAAGSVSITPQGVADRAAVTQAFPAKGLSITNTATVRLPASGAVDVRTSGVASGVTVTVAGYWSTSTSGLVFVPADGARVASVAVKSTLQQVRVAGAGGVPLTARAAVLTARTTGLSAAGWFHVGSVGAVVASTQVVAKSQSLAGTASVPIAPTGTVQVRAKAGTGTVNLDAVGYFVDGSSGVGTGADVSWPQCGSALPTDHAFGIVGVNGELANTTNPCLSSQLSWAALAAGGTAQPTAQLYVLFANPAAAAASAWPTSNTFKGYAPKNPYGSCSTRDGGKPQNSPACSFLYGYALGGDDTTKRGVATPGSHRWWIDVETQFSHQADTSLNRTVLEGMIAGLQSGGATTIGFYSTSSQWATVAGVVPKTSTAYGRSSWIAIGPGTLAAAQKACSGAGLAGGKTVMTQYVTAFGSTTIDRDVSCT